MFVEDIEEVRQLQEGKNEKWKVTRVLIYYGVVSFKMRSVHAFYDIAKHHFCSEIRKLGQYSKFTLQSDL